ADVVRAGIEVVEARRTRRERPDAGPPLALAARGAGVEAVAGRPRRRRAQPEAARARAVRRAVVEAVARAGVRRGAPDAVAVAGVGGAGIAVGVARRADLLRVTTATYRARAHLADGALVVVVARGTRIDRRVPAGALAVAVVVRAVVRVAAARLRRRL